MNLAQMLFEDIISSRLGKDFLSIYVDDIWVKFAFDQKRVWFWIEKKDGQFAGDFSLGFFLRSLNQFFLSGEIERICCFLEKIDLQNKITNRKQSREDRRINNIIKEFILNFLLYRLSYDKKPVIQIFPKDKYLEKVEKGSFYLAERLFPPVSLQERIIWEKRILSFDLFEEELVNLIKREKDKLGGYIFSMGYVFNTKKRKRRKFFKVYLPHIHIHWLVREALVNLGLKIG